MQSKIAQTSSDQKMESKESPGLSKGKQHEPKVKSQFRLKSSQIQYERPMLSVSKQVCSLDVFDPGSSVSHTRPLSRLQQSNNVLASEIMPKRSNLQAVRPNIAIDTNSGFQSRTSLDFNIAE